MIKDVKMFIAGVILGVIIVLLTIWLDMPKDIVDIPDLDPPKELPKDIDMGASLPENLSEIIL